MDGSSQSGALKRNHPMALRCLRVGAVHSIKRAERQSGASAGADSGTLVGGGVKSLPLLTSYIILAGPNDGSRWALKRPRQSQNLTHWSFFRGPESPTTSRGLNRLHGQKNDPG